MTSPDNDKTAYELAQEVKKHGAMRVWPALQSEFSDGDYCRTYVMEKCVENRSESADRDPRS